MVLRLIMPMCLFISELAIGSDIFHDVRSDLSTIDSNYFELGLNQSLLIDTELGKKTRTGDLQLGINGYYRLGSTTIENYSEGFNGLTLGQTLFDSEGWRIELIASQQKYLNFGSGNHYLYADSLDADNFQGMNLGVRGSWSSDNGYFAQLQLFGKNLGDNHDGNSANLFLGKSWNLGKLRLHTLGGAMYASSSINTAIAEAATPIPLQNNQDSSVSYYLEAGASYELDEHWSTRFTLGAKKGPTYDSSTAGMRMDHSTAAGVSLNYKF